MGLHLLLVHIFFYCLSLCPLVYGFFYSFFCFQKVIYKPITHMREREREYEQGKDSAFEVELQRAFYLTS